MLQGRDHCTRTRQERTGPIFVGKTLPTTLEMETTLEISKRADG
jgi:hypothetical protein